MPTRAAVATATSPHIANARGLKLRKGYTAGARAVDAADWRQGLLLLQDPTLEQASAVFQVSVPSICRAQALSPQQREEVRSGWRPLALMPPVPPVLPALPVPVVPTTVPADKPIPPVTMDAEAQFFALVDVLGVDQALALLAARDARDALKKECIAA
jgi:hypothetical protein